MTRKTLGYSKKDEWQQYHAQLQMTHHNFVRTHNSLKILKTQINTRQNMEKIQKTNTINVIMNNRPHMDPKRITNLPPPHQKTWKNL